MKVANSYASLLRGVSQQVPQDRADGQHTEQINMLSDPVNGLSRRHGSVWQAEKVMGSAADFPVVDEDVANWASYDFDYNGKEYVILSRREAKPLFSPLPWAIVYNKTDKLFLNYVQDAGDLLIGYLDAYGVAAMTGVGKYLFMTDNFNIINGQSTNRWDNATNLSRAVVWVRGGAFSRTFKITVRKQNGTSTTVSYTTPASSYQGTLTTADIPAAATDYVKQVNDRVNAYNGAVTAWIGTSVAATQPSAIAEQLRTLLNAAGYTATRVGSHICLAESVLVKSIEVDDGGDGTLIRGVADEIEAAEKTSVVHFVGKVVKVRSKDSAEAYYLKAVPKDPAVTTGYTEVTWEEAAGVEHAIGTGFYYATISGNNFYAASSASYLNNIIPGDHPTFPVSTSGDHESSPMPFFVGRNVTYLGTFQNRLLVGSGGALAVSQTDDYLNFFRTTVLTLPADNPFEMFPQGSEDDQLFHSTLYDQDLVIFGKRRQYLISGTVALTPTSANMPVMASYENVADAAPVSAGGFIFYAKRGEAYSNVFQIQPGQNDKSPESFPASSQIDKYIAGGVTEMLSATGSPSLLFLRTNKSPNSLYAFSYLDKQDGRKMDSWSRWDFNTALGSIVGMSNMTGGVCVISIRIGGTGSANLYAVADYCPTVTGLSSNPYLDSWRSYATVSAGTGSVVLTTPPSPWAAAFNSTQNRRFTGTGLDNVASLITSYGSTGLVVGALQEASFTPTNPFMKDNKDKAILSGRLTVSRFTVAFKESTGFDWSLNYRDSLITSVTFNGRIMGDPTNVVGIEPISTGQHNIPVGRETRQFQLTIKARRWYPFTVTALEWSGQFFNRVQRF